MKEILTADNGSLAAKAGELTEKGMNAVQTLKSQNIWDVLANIIPQDWNDNWDAFKMQLLVGLVIIVALIVLLSVLPSVVRNFIRGLDVAVVGGVLVWLGMRTPEIIFVTEMELPLIITGIVLIVLGIFIFIVSKVVAGKRHAKERRKEEMKHLDEQKLAKETAKPVQAEAVEALPEKEDKKK